MTSFTSRNAEKVRKDVMKWDGTLTMGKAQPRSFDRYYRVYLYCILLRNSVFFVIQTCKKTVTTEETTKLCKQITTASQKESQNQTQTSTKKDRWFFCQLSSRRQWRKSLKLLRHLWRKSVSGDIKACKIGIFSEDKMLLFGSRSRSGRSSRQHSDGSSFSYWLVLTSCQLGVPNSGMSSAGFHCAWPRRKEAKRELKMRLKY